MTEKAHATLGASGAGRWMVCPGAPNAEAGLPDNTSVHAAEGTAAHHLGEQCLRGGEPVSDWEGSTITVTGWPDPFPIDADMVEAVEVYVTYCRSIIERTPLYWLEARVSLAPMADSPGHPAHDMFGTGDFIAYLADEQELVVADYKHGRGVVVEVEGNRQLRYYALGALLMQELKGRPVRRVRIVVIQPRAAHEDGPVREEVMDAVDLLDFADELLEAAEATQDPEAPRVAGDHCRFCKALAFCPEARRSVMDQAKLLFNDAGGIEPPQEAPALLGADELRKVLDAADSVTAWINAAQKAAHDLLERGESVPGWKLVAKRATRQWAPPDGESEKDLAERLVDQCGLDFQDVYQEPKLKSPAQLEKVVRRDDRALLKPYIASVSSGTTLAPEGDRRQSVTPTRTRAQDVFGSQ